VRLRQYLANGCQGALYAIAAVICVLFVECVADSRLELPWGIRLMVLFAVICGGGWIFWRYSPLSRWLSETALALVVERAVPEFKGRFVSAIQLSRSQEMGMSLALIQALLAETVAFAERVDFSRVVQWGAAKKAAKHFGMVLGFVVAASLACGWARSGVLVRRALLSREALPHQTRIDAISGSKTVASGEPVKIEAFADGVIPSTGMLYVKTESGVKREFSLEPDKVKRNRFGRELAGFNESFRYFVKLNDAVSPTFAVTVLARPTVTGIDCEQEYPAYTGLCSVRRSLGDLRLLAGSRLDLKVRTSTRVQRATVKLVGVQQEIAGAVRGPKEIDAVLSIATKGASGFSIQLVDQNGIVGDDGVVHGFEVVPDLPPTVKIVTPERHEESVTPQGVVSVHYQATDDFGIATLKLHYVIGSDDTGVSKGLEKVVSLEFKNPAKEVDNAFEWHIDALRPVAMVGGNVEYWIEAVDNNDVTGPGVGNSEHFHLRIVTPEQKKGELAERLMNSLRALDGVTSDQEKLNQEMKQTIEEGYEQGR